MFDRIVSIPKSASFFLFGPRGTGKTTWLRAAFPNAEWFDLLEPGTFAELLSRPQRLEQQLAAQSRSRDVVCVIDEVQRIPTLLDEVHRLIERNKRWRFVLSGSSARKLRRSGANLLAGRARTVHMHPLSARELGAQFDLLHSLRYGQLPAVYVEADPGRFLKSYVGTYLSEEVQQESLVRNLPQFVRFLEAASFAQASPLSVQNLAADCGIGRQTVSSYLQLLVDLLLAVRLPVFTRRARRAMTAHDRLFFFDAGVYRALRPRGPLDSADEIDGVTAETLVLQELRAANDADELGYELSYWRTRDHREVDFVLYGERGLHGIEVKRSAALREGDLRSLQLFGEDYPEAVLHYFYGGSRRYRVGRVNVMPLAEALPKLHTLLA